MESFDLIVIGGGPGGHAAAEEAARLGARTAILERGGWGGTCTHRGCIPTKALLTCSRVRAALKKAGRLGVRVPDTALDIAAARRHMEQMVRVSALGAQQSLRDAGADCRIGTGSLKAPGEVEWTAQDGTASILQAPFIVIAWGSEPSLPPGIKPSPRVLTSDGFLERTDIPESAVVLGGSFIGVEFATFLAEAGCKVTLAEALDRILPMEDDDVSSFISRELSRLGIAVHTSSAAESIREENDGIRARLAGEAGPLEMEASIALVCTGRRPLLDKGQLDRLGIAFDRQGIRVNENLETTCRGVFAVGDVTGGVLLAHRAAQQGKALASRLFGDGSVRHDDTFVPSVVYTHPPAARVGLTERQAAERSLAIRVTRSDYGANILARTELAGSGFAKAVFQGDRLAGAAVAGEGAGELIAPLTLAVRSGLERTALRNWVLPHPGYSEVFQGLFRD
ncbi:MAG: NAD(P)/FAD-dependent oxidoreductase [Syntrophaceae bacterium]|nr:NAD(P)/FAD-dependent oxidoreductase [Syntrophaceae bacterium]